MRTSPQVHEDGRRNYDKLMSTIILLMILKRTNASVDISSITLAVGTKAERSSYISSITIKHTLFKAHQNLKSLHLFMTPIPVQSIIFRKHRLFMGANCLSKLVCKCTSQNR